MRSIRCLLGHRWTKRRRPAPGAAQSASDRGVYCLSLPGQRVCWVLWSECGRCGAQPPTDSGQARPRGRYATHRLMYR